MISIIDYKAGNLRSVKRALDYLGITSRITDRPLEILTSERVIFPGVGAAGSAMDIIKSKGLDIIIHEVVKQGTPFLGICLGAQIILDRSEEDEAPCLGIISGTARKFAETGLKIPHMGWNSVSVQRRHPILEGIDPRAQFYFVHSFYPEPKKQDEVIATTPYGIEFASVIGSENIIAMQFHPEKSGRYGLQILENFCRWDGTEDM
jgi:glutamine amidotransferase